ncbi:hypothetical protein B0G71_8157 [Paraburkholderia sp. BL27I4N3]|nr:hypothetical protein B0G71_8157 [Paraburkholderia sp. BL27I4N3]
MLFDFRLRRLWNSGNEPGFPGGRAGRSPNLRVPSQYWQFIFRWYWGNRASAVGFGMILGYIVSSFVGEAISPPMSTYPA